MLKIEAIIEKSFFTTREIGIFAPQLFQIFSEKVNLNVYFFRNIKNTFIIKLLIVAQTNFITRFPLRTTKQLNFNNSLIARACVGFKYDLLLLISDIRFKLTAGQRQNENISNANIHLYCSLMHLLVN